MDRRGNNEGSIVKRSDGRWQASISLPDGRRRSFYGKTRPEALQKLRAAQRTTDSGLPLPGAQLTVEKFFTDWIETMKARVKPSTVDRYLLDIRLRVIPALGRKKLVQLTPTDLQLLYSRSLGSGLSPTSVRNLHRVISAALTQGVKWGLLARNVAAMASAPKRRVKEMTTWSGEEASQFLEAASGHRFEAAFVLEVTSGMRQGELLALKWEDVDLTGGRVHIHRTVRRSKAGFEYSEPKTSRSRRQVILSRTALTSLKAHRLSQNAERLRLGPAWEDNALVFANEVGRPVDPQNFYKRGFKRILNQAGLPDIRFHDLRLTAATLMLGQGVHPKVVSDMLGHATVGITLDLYSHVLRAMQQQAVDAMDAIFGN